MAEFASFMLNRQSTPTTSNSNSYKKNSKPYLNSCIPSNTDNISSKTENNVDLSWLPSYNDDNFANGHDKSCHQNEQNDFDDSWLPANYSETKKKSSTSVPILNKPNRSHKNENGLDDSWLPSSTNVKNETKNKGQNYTKKNNTKTTSKSNNSNRSSLPCFPIVKNEDKKKESISIHRKSGNHDYWERAREATTSTAEIQNAKVLQSKKTDSSRSQGRVSPSISESSVETDSLGGVSTLLRRWKDVETKTFNRKERSSSSSNNNNNHSRRPSKYFDGSERCPSPCATDESFIGLESCKPIPSRSLSCSIPSSGTNDMKAFDVEKEKIRMGSIIKKLPKEEELAASQAAKNTSELFAKEHKCVSPVLGKTRLIRGRQAYLDFLSLIEFDKRRELESLTHKRVVSKFPHRGRIQAMLRVRLIRLGTEPKLETRSHKRSVSKTMKTIWDKFSTGVKHGATASRKVNENGEDTRSHASLECSVGCSAVEDMEMTILTATSTIATTTTATNSQELKTSRTSCNQLTQEAKDHHQNAELTMDKFQDVDSSSHSIQSKEDTHSEIMVPNIPDYHEKPQFQSEILNPNGVKEKGYDDSIQLQSDMDLENCHNWISEYSQSQSEWDEDEFYYSNDWISEISRPQSYWEYMRQKRYQEMHHVFSYNRDLQELLERRSVSFFLSSNQRNMLDQLMVSRAQGSSNKQEVLIRESRKEEDDDSRSDRQGSENIEFNDQTTCSSTPAQPRSWSHPNAIYDSYQTPSQSPIPSSLWQNNTPQTSSIEMELIYELRRYVEQLHHEITELRKSITTIKIEQSSQKKTCESINTKRSCCVCDTMQADSFLYRCGHTCTCYDCGLELQCASGKCPICEAPIVDVVRSHTYSE